MADERLTPDEIVLALATKAAIKAAGGLENCVGHTVVGMAQLSRCGSRDHRDSITVRDSARLDALGYRAPGSPHILHALARIAGGVFIQLPDTVADATGLQLSVLELSAELGDVAAAVRDAVSGTGVGGADVTRAERDQVLAQLDDLDRASARLRHQLKALIEV